MKTTKTIPIGRGALLPLLRLSRERVAILSTPSKISKPASSPARSIVKGGVGRYLGS